jgi:hypothetical protein
MKIRYLIAICLLASRLASADELQDFKALREKYKATDTAHGQPRLEKDKYYVIDGFAGQMFIIGRSQTSPYSHWTSAISSLSRSSP